MGYTKVGLALGLAFAGLAINDEAAERALAMGFAKAGLISYQGLAGLAIEDEAASLDYKLTFFHTVRGHLKDEPSGASTFKRARVRHHPMFRRPHSGMLYLRDVHVFESFK